jgi:lipopolysaccharide export system protein LptA
MTFLNILSRNFVFCAVPLVITAGLMATAKAADKLVDTQNAPITIEAAGFLEWDQNKGMYLAEGDATAIQLDTRISADRLEANYDPQSDSREINLMTATGNVSFVDGDNTPQAPRLFMTFNQASIRYLAKTQKSPALAGL